MTAPTDSAEPVATQVRRIAWAWPALGVLVLSLVLFGVHLADELIEGESFSFDTRLLLALRVPGHPQTPVGPAWLLQSAVDITALGGFTLMVLFGLAALVWLLWIRRPGAAAWIAVSLVGSWVIDQTLKHWIARPRPELVPHLAQVTDASFPSGHAMVSAAVYLTLALMLADGAKHWTARAAIVAFGSLIAILIGCSRVYLGVHWPSDVLAGWSLGTAWALAVWAGNRWLRHRRQAR